MFLSVIAIENTLLLIYKTSIDAGKKLRWHGRASGALSCVCCRGLVGDRDRAQAAESARLDPSNGKTKMMALMEAAAAACEAARREGMAGVIPIYRMSVSNAFEKLARPGTAKKLQSLYIRKQDLQTYVRWARTMQ